MIDARTGQWRRSEKRWNVYPEGDYLVALSPDGRLVAALPHRESARWIRAFNVDTLELVQELAIDPVPTRPGNVQGWMDEFWAERGTSEYEAEVAKVAVPGFFFGIEMISCACNGRFLVCYSHDNTVYVINIGERTWRVQRTIPISQKDGNWSPWLVDTPFSPDRRWVVDNLDNGTLVIRAFDPACDVHPCDIIAK